MAASYHICTVNNSFFAWHISSW